MVISQILMDGPGRCKYPQNIFRAGKCEKSHDTIHWAHVFSQWCLRDGGVYVENIRDIFDVLSLLNASRIHVPTLQNETYPKLLDAIMKRSGLVPPSECCVTLHEVVHICEQVKQIGNCRHSTLFKFEKVNKVMKAHDVLPSKFVLAHTPDLQVAFIALDPERIGDQLTHDVLLDFGDDILLYKQQR